MNLKVRILIGLVITGLISGAVYWWHLSNKNIGAGTELVLYGNVDIREVHLAFNGSEHVSDILVDEGDQVKAGQLLARLQTERLQAALDQASAEVIALKAESKSAALSYQRIKSLASRKLASTDEADVAEAKSLSAKAYVAAGEAVRAVAEQALKDAYLYAPANGVIRDRIVEPGDFVTPQTPVLTLALLNPVWVRTYLPETYLGKVKPGAPAHISTDSYPGKIYQGWVGSISPTAEFTPKNVETPELRTRLVYQMRVFICNPLFELRLGMPATVSIDLNATPVAAQAEPHCAQTNQRPEQ